MAICIFSIPNIIAVAKVKRLYDKPDGHRKIHKTVVPNLGGIGVFLAYTVISSLFVDTAVFTNWHYIVGASFILFIVGVKDDIVSLSPSKKFIAQILASFITVVLADVRLKSLHGILGVHELPYLLSIIFSIVGTVFVTNAFNLIDGIDGLAGSISVLCTFTLGTALAFEGHYSGAIMAFTLMGAILGFLKYNIAPATIFMGDSGSLFIGFTVSVLSILFINSYTPGNNLFTHIAHTPQSALLIALSIVVIPVFDSFRVFIARIAKGHHPFHADKTHLHHFLLDSGFSHTRAVMILVTANLIVISTTLSVQDYNPNLALAVMFAVSFGLFTILYYVRKNRLAQVEKLKSASTLADANQLKMNEPAVNNYNGVDIRHVTNGTSTLEFSKNG